MLVCRNLPHHTSEMDAEVLVISIRVVYRYNLTQVNRHLVTLVSKSKQSILHNYAVFARLFAI